jgi:hypothetical protein
MDEYKSEAHLQSLCVKWFDREYLGQQGRLFLVYNNPPNARMGAVLKSMGLRRGAADLCYYAPNKRAYWIEMKLPGETQSKPQQDFERMVKEAGDMYAVCSSEQEFKMLIKNLN